MNSAPQVVPGLRSLYRQDSSLGGWVRTAFFGLVVAGGMQWAARGITFAPDAQEFEGAFVKWVTVGGVVMAILGTVLLLRRFLWLRKAFTQGAVVKATVLDLETTVTEDGKDSTGRTTTRRDYFVTLSYDVLGSGRLVRLKIPGSGSLYGLKKGADTDLVVLHSAPEKPLIRAVYLSRI